MTAPTLLLLLSSLLAGADPGAPSSAPDLERLLYNHPGLVVDLGVGLWATPLPMDYDRDGDLDLVVVCSDKPYNGTWFFENPGGGPWPVFKPGRRIGPGPRNVQVSYPGGEPRVLVPGHEYVNFRDRGFGQPVAVYPETQVHNPEGRVRANQWTYVDWEGDGDLDLVVGSGDWTDYGWDDAFDANGEWTRGPLRGYVDLILNRGTTDEPRHDPPVRVQAGGRPLEVFGMPSPNLADMDGDGDLDIVCGEFLDRLTYFENVGDRAHPRYAEGRFLEHEGGVIHLDLQMIAPVALDWDGDGDVDLVVGEEDGRVAYVENTGRLVGGAPLLAPPRHFQQEAHEVKFGALVTPFGFDWDGDGDEDLICGNTAGYVGFLENLDGGDPPRWAAPRYLEADGEVIRIQAGPNGSIQGPAEAKWGYTTLSVADWDHDGLPDLVVNSIWGEVVWHRNVGSRARPVLAAAAPVEVQWPGAPPNPAWNWWTPRGRQLVTQWRTTPFVVDFDRDGLNDLVMLDHEGHLALFARQRTQDGLALLPGRRVFVGENGASLELTRGRAGKSGRRKLAVVDWNGDGHLDVLLNGTNTELHEGRPGPEGTWVLTNRGPIAARDISKHSTSPTVVDWNRDGVLDAVVGAEDGYLYYLRRAAPPNFIVILADDLGYGDLSSYGSERNRTPHIDRLAAEGLRFTDFHSNGPMCSPTRAALLTGLYQQRFGPRFEGALSGRSDRDRGLPLDAVTIAEALKHGGYATGMFGKWHLGYRAPYLPTRQGFDEYRGLVSGDGDHHTHVDRSGNRDWWNRDALEMEEGYTADLITRHSVGFIERHADEPFFLFVSHLAIHFPWQGRDDPAHRVAGRDYWEDKWGVIPHENDVSPHVAAMVAALDDSVGDIVATLGRLGLERRTLVFFASDNGGYRHYAGRFHRISSNGPLRGQKGGVFEGGHRVPAVARWPGRISPGVCDQTVLTFDLFPTLLALAGVEPRGKPGRLDGVDLSELLLEGAPLPPRTLFWRARNGASAVRQGRWKLVSADGGAPMLFDLAADLGEERDVAAGRPEVVEALLAAFGDWEADVEGGDARGTGAP